MGFVAAPLPPVLKPIQHYLKAATEHETRDPVVSYWCRLYALQAGLKLDKKSKESLNVLVPIMEWLEKDKKQHHDNEAITQEIVAKAHIENYALKLFTWADSEDRASHFTKNVVKAFYTAGVMMDVLQTFGELDIEMSEKRKYAKWKAAYIHNCLKNGETPVPGPQADGLEDFQDPSLNEGFGGPANAPHDISSQEGNMPIPAQRPLSPGQGMWPSVPQPGYNPPPQHYTPPVQPHNVPYGHPGQSPSTHYGQPTTPAFPSHPPATQTPTYPSSHVPAQGHIVPTPEQVKKVEKYCRFTMSALNYDDMPEAIKNLELALKLLKTGHD